MHLGRAGDGPRRALYRNSLRLTVNARQRAVDRPWKRKFLGFTLTCQGTRLKVAEHAIDKLKACVRA